MDFAFSEEQDEYRETLRRFLEEKCPTAEVFRLLESDLGYDPGLWKQMAEELGLQGVAIPEAYGGQGFSFLELGIALEEMGRVLLPSPFYASACLAASAILAAGSEDQKAELLPGIAGGTRIASLAVAEPGAGWDVGALAAEARRDGDGYRLTGSKAWVPDGASADLLVVAARLGAAPELFALPADADGVSVSAVPSLDPTRRQAQVELNDAPAQLLGAAGGGAAALAETLEHAAIGLAAEMAGGAGRCLEMAVAYASERRQFGRVIGSFQAIKHKAAEVLLEVESARSAAWWACWTAAERSPERREASHLAKAVCADAYRRAAAENVQIHGGIGFTWEAAPHLYYRRAQVSETLFGDSVRHRALLAQELGIPAR